MVKKTKSFIFTCEYWTKKPNQVFVLNKLQNFINQLHTALYKTLALVSISLTFVFQISCPAILRIPLMLWIRRSITCVAPVTSAEMVISIYTVWFTRGVCIWNLTTDMHATLTYDENNIFQVYLWVTGHDYLSHGISGMQKTWGKPKIRAKCSSTPLSHDVSA